MPTIETRLEALDWNAVTSRMNDTGYALLPSILTAEECAALIREYDDPDRYRKTIQMERYRFGSGEYKYFRYPLPDLIQAIRTTVYPRLSAIANGWMKTLHMDQSFPDTLSALQAHCAAHQQTQPTVLILKYEKGGHNTLHQDLYGEIFFPIQLVLFLNDPGKDYKGGEFVLLQQTPRAQSKAMVLQPRKGDMLLLTTNFRPAKGSRGYYRVNMKHGVSEVQEGQRYSLGIIFHDAK